MARDENRLSDRKVEKANPSRGGDAKPGISVHRETARLPKPGRTFAFSKGNIVKSILARLSLALMMLGAMALTTGAGMRWQS